MKGTLTEQLISAHLLEGTPRAGEEVALRIDQTLTQDATGTLVMQELDALELDRARTERSVQYVDHNLLQQDHRNADDHRFLRSACERFGVIYSPPGRGVSHVVHQECFGIPGKTLLGADSHTPAAGALGMLAFGAGGISVAFAMAGEPYRLVCPRVRRILLEGRLPIGVSAKDLVLELLARHGVDGGRSWIFEYDGPGLPQLSCWDRHVIANMGTEMGVTTSIFPADAVVEAELVRLGRGHDFHEWRAERDARYDAEEVVDLDRLEPRIALPSSPGKVRFVHELEGLEIAQAYVGSSANPGYRDFAVVAETLRGRTLPAGISLDVNPASRRVLLELTRSGHLGALLEAGARLHQTGCNGCIGMGQAPPSESVSLRTVPRNFPGRSGTLEDQVHLVSPETAVASALEGRITDPRKVVRMRGDEIEPPSHPQDGVDSFHLPPSEDQGRLVELIRGPNIAPLPELEPLPESLRVRVLLELGDDVSTDEILPAGTRTLPDRSHVGRLARHAFRELDPDYVDRASAVSEEGHAIVAGRNYGQGSSREHAALVPRASGLRVVIAESLARIHRQNLIAFGVLPLTRGSSNGGPKRDDVLSFEDVHGQLARGRRVDARDEKGETHAFTHDLSEHERDLLRSGGALAWMRRRL